MALVALLITVGLPVLAGGPAFAGTMTPGQPLVLTPTEQSSLVCCADSDVATFTDTDTTKSTSDFTVSIDWGDG
ncbi:MAG TPA: hypothetical protein VNY84_12925, partial [Acidimicrobiales bacterium]|nr:hypothetical protein [Acidimicrobiales bacterium]